MHTGLRWILATTLLLPACRPPGQTEARAAVHPQAVSVTPSDGPELTARASTTPTQTSAPAASSAPLAASTPPGTAGASPAPLGVLQAPTGTTVKLTGSVLVDATYVVSAGSGSLIGNNGSSLVVGLTGSGVVANNGGNLVASTAGGAALAGQDGSLLAAGIVSNNGGGLAGKSTYKLTQAATAQPVSTANNLLPAAGMLVSAVSLRTHQYVPLGADGQGQPVYAVYSDAAGGYQLYLPASEEDSVLLVANAPGGADARLSFNTVSPRTALAPAATIDGDTALATRLARTAISAQFAKILTAASVDDTLAAIAFDSSVVPDVVKPILSNVLTQIYTRARAAKLPLGADATDLPDMQLLSDELADMVLGFTPYDSLHIAAAPSPEWTGPDAQVYEGLGFSFKALREAAGAYMQAQRQQGASLPISLNVLLGVELDGHPTAPRCSFTDRVALQTPQDLSVYLAEDVYGRFQYLDSYNAQNVYQAVALAPLPADNPFVTANPDVYTDPTTGAVLRHDLHIQACATALLGAFIGTLAQTDPAGGPGAAMAAVLSALDAFAAARTFAGPARPRPHLGLVVPCVPSPYSAPAATGAAAP